MTSRKLRVSLILIALLFASGCARGDETAVADELPLDDTGLIATFDVGYEVPLDIPEEVENRNNGNDDSTDAGTSRGERNSAEDPPDGLAMADEEAEASSGDADDPEDSIDASPTEGADDESADASAATAESESAEEAGPDESGTEDEWPADPQLRDDGLLYVRSPVFEDGRWKSIALLAPDGKIVWSYEGCDDFGCTHDDILVLPNGNVAVTATSTVDGQRVDNVLELEPVIGEGCASREWCTGVARHSQLNARVPDGYIGAITLLGAAEDYGSWEVLSIADGSTTTVPAV